MGSMSTSERLARDQVKLVPIGHDPPDQLPSPGSFPGCRSLRWVRIADLELRSRLDWSEYAEEGGFWVSCGKCDNCINNRVRDWQGRMIGESHGADHCFMVTITVGGDKYLYPRGLRNEKAERFHKDDVQAFMKRLKEYQRVDWRRRVIAYGKNPAWYVPPSLRYFYVGERGDEFARIHYHLAVYLTGSEAPDGIPFREDFFHGQMDRSCNEHDYPLMPRCPSDRTYWPWGFSNWKPFDAGHAAYLASYISKDAAVARGNAAAEVMRPGITTKPLFGGFYFDDWARRHVDAQLSPTDRTYTVPKADTYFGRARQFFMSKSTVKRMILSFAAQWDDAYEADPENFPRYAPESPLVRRFFEAREDRKLGTPQLAMERAQFFMICRERQLVRERQAAARLLTVEELADSGVVIGSDRRLLKGMFDIPRTADRVALMGNRIEHKR